MRLAAYDSETHLIQPGLLAPPIVCGSVAFDASVGGPPFLLNAKDALAWLRENLKDTHIIGANIAYDMAVAAAADESLLGAIFEAYEAGRIHDVQIRESLIDIERGQLGVDPVTGRKPQDDESGMRYSLAMLVFRYLGIDISKTKTGPDIWRLRYAELDGVPLENWPAAAREYPLDDARYTLAVFLAQEEAAAALPNGGNLHDEARSVYNAWVLHLISCWGMRTDPAKVAALEARVEAEHTASLVEFQKAGIIREDGTENKKKVQELVSSAYAGDPPTTPKGGIATDRDTKIESGDPLLVAHGNSGKGNKYRTTYLPKIKEGINAPINPKFYGMAATTRVTSDYQQLPKKGGIRECHVARPGFVYCSVDYGGLELRTMSQRAIWEPEVGYSKMAESLLEGKDVHCVAAGEMLGITYEETITRHKAKDSQVSAFRALAKIFNFGKGGGMGAKTLVYHARAKEGVRFCQVMKKLEKCGSEGFETIHVRGQAKRVCKVCVEISEDLNAGWLAAWPEQAALFAIASRRVNATGETEAMIPVIDVRRSACGYSQWLNTPFQALGAVITTLAMRHIAREMYVEPDSMLYGSRLVLNVHDELIAEIREDGFRNAAWRIADLMKKAGAEVLPDLGKAIEAEPAVSRFMSKDAEPVRDTAGLLQIWEPKPEKAAA